MNQLFRYEDTVGVSQRQMHYDFNRWFIVPSYFQSQYPFKLLITNKFRRGMSLEIIIKLIMNFNAWLLLFFNAHHFPDRNFFWPCVAGRFYFLNCLFWLLNCLWFRFRSASGFCRNQKLSWRRVILFWAWTVACIWVMSHRTSWAPHNQYPLCVYCWNSR